MPKIKIIEKDLTDPTTNSLGDTVVFMATGADETPKLLKYGADLTAYADEKYSITKQVLSDNNWL